MLGWALSVVLLGLAAYLAWGQKGSHAGAVIWCAVWGMMLFLYRLFGPQYDYEASVVMMVGVFCLLFVGGVQGGAFVVGFRSKYNVDDEGPKYFEFRWIRTFLGAMVLLGMGAPIKFAATAGIDPGRILNITNYFDVIQDTHAMMVTGMLEQDPVTKICMMFAMTGVLVAGLYMGLDRPGKRLTVWQCIATITPCVIMTMLTTLRSATIAPLLIMVSGFIAGMTVRGTEHILYRVKPALTAVGVVLILLTLIIVMQSIRLGDYQFRDVGGTFAHMRPWAAGYMPALTFWYQKVWDGQLLWGALSFKGLVSLLGMQGEGFDKTFQQMPIGMNETSNAMTCLRTFIADFGVGGAMVFGALYGFITGVLSEWSRKGSVAAAVVLGALLAAIIWSPNGWFLGYGTRLLSPLVAAAYVLAFVRRTTPPIVTRKPHAEGSRVAVKVRARPA